MLDPYEVLNIPEDASEADIKKAYRKLAMDCHPDKGGDEEKFKQISEAYSILTDEDSRRQWEASQRGPGGFGDIFDGFEDMFGSFFGGPKRRNPAPQEQADDQIMFDLRISLEHIKAGVAQQIEFQRNRKCKKCEGRGGQNKRTCALCKGTGMETFRSGNLFQHATCRGCHGDGAMFEIRCDYCAGKGAVKVRDSITLKIEEVK